MKHPILASILAGGFAGAVGSVGTGVLLSPDETRDEPLELTTTGDVSGDIAALREQNELLAERIAFLEQRPMTPAPVRVAESSSSDMEIEAQLKELAASLQSGAVSEPLLNTVSAAVEQLREQEQRERDERRAVQQAERLEERLSELALELGLDVNQTNQMRTILTDGQLRRDEMMRAGREAGDWGNMRETMRTLRDETRTAVQGVLGPDQYDKYLETERGRGRGFGGGGGGGGGGNDGQTTGRRRSGI